MTNYFLKQRVILEASKSRDLRPCMDKIFVLFELNMYRFKTLSSC